MNYLLKIGGSLTPQYILPLYSALKEVTDLRNDCIFLFPGGGDFADVIRKYRCEINFSDKAAHKMALAALDQNAHLISDICQCPCIRSLEAAYGIKKGLTVIAPYELMMKALPFSDYDLDIDTLSSTSSAIYWAYRLKAEFIVATDVDGIFDQDPLDATTPVKLFSEISTVELKNIKRGGALDETVPRLLERYGMNARVVNGKVPEQWIGLITGKYPFLGTVIRSS